VVIPSLQKKFKISVLLFFLLTALGIFWAAHHSEIHLNNLGIFVSLSLESFFYLFLLAVALYFAEMFRFRAFSQSLGLSLSWYAAFEATVCDFFFSWITPGASMGTPAAIFMLRRHGFSWDQATAVAFGKMLTSVGSLLLIAFIVLIQNDNFFWGSGVSQILLLSSGVFLIQLIFLLIAAHYPKKASSWVMSWIEWVETQSWMKKTKKQKYAVSFLRYLYRSVERLLEFRHAGLLDIFFFC